MGITDLDKGLYEIYKVSLKGFYLTRSALVPVLGHVARVGLVGVDVVLVLAGKDDLADFTFGFRTFVRHFRFSFNTYDRYFELLKIL